MATFSDLKTSLAAELRDTTNVVFTTAELGALINRGIDALADFRPEEIVASVTVSAGVVSYTAASQFSNIFSVRVYSSAGSYLREMPTGMGDGPHSGWEFHGGVLYIPPANRWATAGDVLQIWGYGRYIQLSADSATTDLDASGINAVLTYAQWRALDRLLMDRAKFQQYQREPGNSDVSLIQIAQTASVLRSSWQAEQQRLRRLRRRA